MTSISNNKTGNNITLLLERIIVPLAGSSSLPLWGAHRKEEPSATLVRRLAEAPPVEKISADIAGTVLTYHVSLETAMDIVPLHQSSSEMLRAGDQVRLGFGDFPAVEGAPRPTVIHFETRILGNAA